MIFPAFAGAAGSASLDAFPGADYRSAASHDPPSGAWAANFFKTRIAMARRCELTGKTRQIGHRVSHSNRKTKRRFLPNLLNVTLMSDVLGKSVRLRISANALKSVDHRGGLDAFLIKAKDADLSPRALELKKQVTK